MAIQLGGDCQYNEPQFNAGIMTVMPEMYLIVGLGNPGSRYENTRHNVGFRVVEKLADKHGLSFGKTEQHALTASGTILNKRVLLAKPMTYMNLSGDAVQPLVSFYKISLDHILIVGDDIDLPLGTLRLAQVGQFGRAERTQAYFAAVGHAGDRAGALRRRASAGTQAGCRSRPRAVQGR